MTVDFKSTPLEPLALQARVVQFGMVEGRAVAAAFDAGLVTSDAGALFLGATNQAIDLVDRFADCFRDRRCQEQIEHTVSTLVGQRVFAIALGYEDLNDHDELRHDLLMAVLAGKLQARRKDYAPVAGKSTLSNTAAERLSSSVGVCPSSPRHSRILKLSESAMVRICNYLARKRGFRFYSFVAPTKWTGS